MGLGRGQAEWGSPLPQRGAWAAPQAASSLFGRMRASGALQGGGADVFVLRVVCKGAWWVLLLTSLLCCALPLAHAVFLPPANCNFDACEKHAAQTAPRIEDPLEPLDALQGAEAPLYDAQPSI